MITPINNHEELALDRLREQYKQKPKLAALILSLIGEVQTLEDVLQSLQALRGLEQAEGIQLDNLGDIIGLDRSGGESDDTYRLRLRAKIAQNISQGEPEAVIALTSLLLGADHVVLSEGVSGSVTLDASVILTDQAMINATFRELEFSLAAGVRLDTLTGFDPDDCFAFEGTDAGQGFADDNDPSVGGGFATEYLNSNLEFGFDGDDPKVGGFGSDNDPLVGGVFIDA